MIFLKIMSSSRIWLHWTLNKHLANALCLFNVRQSHILEGDIILLYIMQPKIIAAKLRNYFMYNPPAPYENLPALLYITTKHSLKSRALINFTCHKAFVAWRPLMLYGQINHSWHTAIHDLSENNVWQIFNKHSANTTCLFNFHWTLFYVLHFAPLFTDCFVLINHEWP